jgi:CrcB protein
VFATIDRVTLLLVGAGGFFGAISRYLVDGWVSDWTGGTFPWGTLVINLSGSFVLGLLFALSIERAAIPSSIRAPILVGFIGAYTTFSTLTLESWRLVEDGSWALGIANIGGSMLLGMVAVVAGLTLGRAL